MSNTVLSGHQLGLLQLGGFELAEEGIALIKLRVDNRDSDGRYNNFKVEHGSDAACRSTQFKIQTQMHRINSSKHLNNKVTKDTDDKLNPGVV